MKMKKIFLGLFAGAAMLTSCDMDTRNFGVIDQDIAIESVDDAHKFMNGIYGTLRTISGSDFIVYGDVQMDQFVGLVDNGNRLGPYSTGQIVASDNDLSTLYYNMYINVNKANYLVPKIDALVESGSFSNDDIVQLNYYKGSALFASAYSYWWLFDKYVNYSTANLDTPGMGLQIETEYHPSGDRGSYVGRSTIRESVNHINKLLSDAYDLVVAYEEDGNLDACHPNSSYVSSYVIAALQARIALQTGDYTTALAKAEAVINSGNYGLASVDDYPGMWLNDMGNELIFVCYAEKGQGGIGTGVHYLANNSKESSDYIPTADVLLSYEDGDVRFDSCFELYQPMVVSGESYYAFAFNKYPGNPALNTGTTNALLNAGKPFRLSEQYLIAAEAAYETQNETKANAYLNDLRSARIEGYASRNYSGNALRTAIRDERGKELIGEGFRMGDLRRWGEGFTREAGFANLGYPFDAILAAVTPTTNNVTYAADDYRFIWPIPTREMQVNPQLAGQQNPRY